MAERPDAPRYVVAGCRPWNRATFARLAQLPGSWSFAATPDELARSLAEEPPPRTVFFLHWSWIVPAEVHEAHECVVFHMTDLPYGRGGSPLQNLVVRGHRTTTLTALQMTAALDAGPIYAKVPLSLEGPAEAVYLRADDAAADLVATIVAERPTPVAQVGEPVVFARRTPADSALPTALADLDAVADFVAMLDAEGYPHAFIDHGVQLGQTNMRWGQALGIGHQQGGKAPIFPISRGV